MRVDMSVNNLSCMNLRYMKIVEDNIELLILH